ncbi:HAD family hydrolase [[Kitasatospora] papulosa]|uniref:HAD family hydrolase n=1 Tax=Streptomyces TaxID=1883 RepID=UPI002E77D61E|nr:HAD family hydrolase [Streptomyces sp. JV181]MEE1776396.1 HAD hydrolase-like protein [Streptomyces sp. JV181]
MSARRDASLSGATDRCPAALLEAADCVLFDFDGPLCDLFSGRPASGVAERLAGELRDVDPVVAASAAGDPLALLQAVAKHHGSSPATDRAERFLTTEEAEAAGVATPTAYALELIGALDAGGWRQAVTTNNSPAAVIRFLERHGLSVPAVAHIHGRTSEPGLLKPDPHCLVRALESTGSTAQEAVMIGDSPADCLAAKVVGVPFIGYAVNGRKRRALEDVGARCTVPSLRGLLEAARRRVRSREPGAGPPAAGVHG